MAAHPTYIRDLKADKVNGDVKGRITRLWTSPYGSIGFLLNDEMEGKIYCEVWSLHTSKHVESLTEGSFIELSGYKVEAEGANYRYCRNVLKIVFDHNTTAIPIGPLKIPRYCFDLCNVGEIEAGYVPTNVLIDFYGRLILSSIKRGPEQSTRVTFLLEDKNGDLMRVYLWDELAVKILDLQSTNAGPYNIVVAGCFLHICEEYVSIQGVAKSTSLYINVDIEEGMHNAAVTESWTLGSSPEEGTNVDHEQEATSTPIDSVLEKEQNKPGNELECGKNIGMKRQGKFQASSDAKKKIIKIIDLTKDD